MTKFIRWSSQPLDEWAQKYAQGKFVDINGHSTHYIEMGSGDPVILVHGFLYDTFTWHNNIKALAHNHHDGIYSQDEGGSVDIANSSITENGEYGVAIWRVSESSIVSSQIKRNGWGGIFSRYSEFTVSGTTVSANGTNEDATAGGIRIHWSSVSIIQSSILDNTSWNSPGAGIHIQTCDGNQMLIRDTSITGNQTGSEGGGLYNRGCPVFMTNVTLSGNIAGSGISNGSDHIQDGSITMAHNTIAWNLSVEDGAGIDSPQDDVFISNSILAFNGDSNCNGMVFSGGQNLDSSDACSLNIQGDLTNTDPLLGPLADNGGGTLTHALLAGSPAIDSAGDANCPAADQRGVDRPIGNACDIGAYKTDELPDGPHPSLPVETVPVFEDQAIEGETPLMPTETKTPILEESNCVVTVLVNLFCRPGSGYDPIDSFTPNQSTTAYAQSPGGEYLFVYGINNGRQCTVPNNPKYVETAGTSCSSLPYEELQPPTPTASAIPTPTATSTPKPETLSAPSPLSPSGTLNCADVTGGTKLKWSAVSHPNGIDNFEWELSGPTSDSGSTSSTKASTSGLSCVGSNYQWRVRAVDGKGNISPWSDYSAFTVP